MSNEGVELFPSKVVNGGGRLEDGGRDTSQPRSPQRRRRIEQSHPTFSSITRDLEVSDQSIRSSQRIDVIDDDLFPDKLGGRQLAAMDAPIVPPKSAKSTSLANRIQGSGEFSFRNGSQSQLELFPEKLAQQSSVELFPEKVGRIQSNVELFPEKVEASLQERISGKSLAERIREAEDDPSSRELFPGLVRRTGEPRRRRRAEDHF